MTDGQLISEHTGMRIVMTSRTAFHKFYRGSGSVSGGFTAAFAAEFVDEIMCRHPGKQW